MGVLSSQLCAGVQLALTTRHGVQSGAAWRGFNVADHCADDPARVAANRAWLQDTLDVDHIQWLKQVHAADCVRVVAPGGVAPVARTPAAGMPVVEQSLTAMVEVAQAAQAAAPPVPQADAAVTHLRRMALAIMVADCLPVLLADTAGSGVGAAHAGWRGLAAGVLGATVAALDCPPQRLVAWLGPHVRAAHYEVDAPVREALALHPGSFVVSRPGHWLLDLGAVARAQLTAAGVGRIVDCGRCAFSDARAFYSHRREQPTGRNAALIWLR